MIKNAIPALLAERFGGKKEINLSQVARDTGMEVSTIRNYARETITRFDASTLETWCKYFGVGVGDLLIYTPDDEPTVNP